MIFFNINVHHEQAGSNAIFDRSSVERLEEVLTGFLSQKPVNAISNDMDPGNYLNNFDAFIQNSLCART